MARREWADKLADAQTCPQCAEQYGMGDNGDIVHVWAVVRLFHKEHARAVRIVKRELAERERTLANAALPSFDYDWVEPQVVVLRRILDILQKGRA